MKSQRLACRLVALLGIVVGLLAAPLAGGAGVGSMYDDLVLDLGRGPVTVHVPPTYDPSHPAPLVMLLHGWAVGASGQQVESYFQLLPWSDQLGFLYVFPDGTVDQSGARFWNATDACCDYYGNGVDDSGYLRALIDAIIAELSVDTERVYVLGWSNGGFMAYRMACDHADIVAAVASLAGATYLDPADCTPSAPVRTLQIHGTADVNAPYEGGDAGMGPFPGAVATTEQWATYNQCSMVPDLTRPPLDLDWWLPGSETVVTRYADGCAPGGFSELWTMVGGDHFPHLSSDFAPLVLDFLITEGPESYQSFFPAAAVAAGAQGAFFQTDLEINNKGTEPASVTVQWLPRGQNNSEPMESDPIALAPGQSLRYENVLTELFGLEPDSVGALKLVASTDSVIGMSRTYNVPGAKIAGTFGQGLPAIPSDQLIPSAQVKRLIFMSENSDTRANVGCVNGLDTPVHITLELYNSAGTLLAVKTMNLGPWSNSQINRIFGDDAPVNGYVDVSSQTEGAAFYCYGSVLDNLTSDPTTVLPQTTSGATLFIPAVALAAGLEDAFFSTDVDLNNAGGSPAQYELGWLPRGADNSDPTMSGPFTLAAGASVRYENVLAEIFGLVPDEVGALVVEAGSEDLLAMSRTYNLPPAKVAGTFGQELPGIPADQMIPTGVKKRIIFMNENDDVRSNVGCQNAGLNPVAVKIELHNADGERLGTRTMELPPLSNDQMTRVFRNHAPISAGYVDVWTDTEGASIYCYGSVLDNLTSDPTTVLPQ